MVASEVRNLAIKSAETLKEAEEHTNEIISNIDGIKNASTAIMNEVSATQENVMNTENAVDALNQSSRLINTSVNEVTEIIQNLSEIASGLTESSNYNVDDIVPDMEFDAEPMY